MEEEIVGIDGVGGSSADAVEEEEPAGIEYCVGGGGDDVGGEIGDWGERNSCVVVDTMHPIGSHHRSRRKKNERTTDQLLVEVVEVVAQKGLVVVVGGCLESTGQQRRCRQRTHEQSRKWNVS